MMLLSVLESMQTQPAQPPSGRIAHLFSCLTQCPVLRCTCTGLSMLKSYGLRNRGFIPTSIPRERSQNDLAVNIT
ncbi:MAG: hypothetical protein LBL62_02270 [Planctomycetaceae bacterium]|nr:hypothetical protein [Planctomycetaceae bacterium]